MALSLADELELDLEMAGEGGGGMSLADEFGGGGDMLEGGDDLAAELDAALGDAEGTGASLADDLEEDLGRGGGIGDFDGSGDGGGDDGAQVLEPGTPPGYGYGSLSHGRTPTRTPARTPRGASRHSRVPSARAAAVAADDDPLDLAPLHEAMQASARMCALLRDMDGAGAGPAPAGPSGAGGSSTSTLGSASGSGTRATGPALSASTPAPRALAPPQPVEERLAGYISRLTASERTRDDQARDVAALVRDLEGVVVRDEDLRWVDLVLDDGISASAVGAGAGVQAGADADDSVYDADTPRVNGHDHDHDHDSLETNGYTDPAGSPSPRHARPNGAGALESIVESPPPPAPGSSTPSPTSPTSPLSPISPSAGRPAASRLSLAVGRLGADTGSAASALGSLRDGASVGATSAAGAARTLRGLRLAIGSLRDGQAAEDAAQRAVDAYEARVESLPRARATVDAITAGLEARLAELADAHVARCRRPCPVP